MSKLNFNSIFSWVDSHIIDYPKAMQNIMIFIALLLLIFFSPYHSIFWLLFSTVYFLYYKKYKNIVTIWGAFFFSLYFIFTACMFGFDGNLLVRADLLDFDIEILIRAKVVSGKTCEDSYRLVWYVIDTYRLDFLDEDDKLTSFFNARLGNLCLLTIFSLSWLSSKLGISIYVPSLFHGLIYIFKFIFGGNPPAKCSPEKDSDDSPYPSPNPSPKSVFSIAKSMFGKSKPPSMSDGAICDKLRKDLKDSKGIHDLYNLKSRVVKGRKFTYIETNFFLEIYRMR